MHVRYDGCFAASSSTSTEGAPVSALKLSLHAVQCSNKMKGVVNKVGSAACGQHGYCVEATSGSMNSSLEASAPPSSSDVPWPLNLMGGGREQESPHPRQPPAAHDLHATMANMLVGQQLLDRPSLHWMAYAHLAYAEANVGQAATNLGQGGPEMGGPGAPGMGRWSASQANGPRGSDLHDGPVAAVRDWPTLGSVGHPSACKSACPFKTRRKGCKDGRNCPHCHICRCQGTAAAGASLAQLGKR
ncbi:unnamed protein product [Polarella glacialis]|uniref:C3H1-type domain-containing protein n=2 Tax=Polarella glacialis TaxID=89957 RepID=A0A813HAS0_POLGL|nr:unnamed protein product [Polarella glacialis]CAE8641188.1 unnamed protein product [Polarella glacialis]